MGLLINGKKKYLLFYKWPFKYYVSSFLDFFWPIHPLCTDSKQKWPISEPTYPIQWLRNIWSIHKKSKKLWIFKILTVLSFSIVFLHCIWRLWGIAMSLLRSRTIAEFGEGITNSAFWFFQWSWKYHKVTLSLCKVTN